MQISLSPLSASLDEMLLAQTIIDQQLETRFPGVPAPAQAANLRSEPFAPGLTPSLTPAGQQVLTLPPTAPAVPPTPPAPPAPAAETGKRTRRTKAQIAAEAAAAAGGQTPTGAPAAPAGAPQAGFAAALGLLPQFPPVPPAGTPVQQAPQGQPPNTHFFAPTAPVVAPVTIDTLQTLVQRIYAEKPAIADTAVNNVLAQEGKTSFLQVPPERLPAVAAALQNVLAG